MKLITLVVVAAAIALLGPAPGAYAESAATYPSGNVELVIPFQAGGTTDVIGRLVANMLARSGTTRSWSPTRPERPVRSHRSSSPARRRMATRC